MRTTPPIPAFIRAFSHPGYTNLFSLLPNCPRLYVTETLLGDWDAPTLLLAKDAAPTGFIRERIAREGDAAWRHSDRARGDRGGCKTNERLVKLAASLPGAKLYGSALANLMFDDPGWSRALPGLRAGPLHDHLVKTLRWVITEMPNLRAIACLGAEAWLIATCAVDEPAHARNAVQFRDDQRPLLTTRRTAPLRLSAHYHPAARVGATKHALGWPCLSEYLSGSGLPVAA